MNVYSRIKGTIVELKGESVAGDGTDFARHIPGQHNGTDDEFTDITDIAR